MRDEAISRHRVEEEALPVAAQQVERLPWRHCVALMLMGSAVCYGVGFAVAAAFVHLMKVF